LRQHVGPQGERETSYDFFGGVAGVDGESGVDELNLFHAVGDDNAGGALLDGTRVELKFCGAFGKEGLQTFHLTAEALRRAAMPAPQREKQERQQRDRAGQPADVPAEECGNARRVREHPNGLK